MGVGDVGVVVVAAVVGVLGFGGSAFESPEDGVDFVRGGGVRLVDCELFFEFGDENQGRICV